MKFFLCLFVLSAGVVFGQNIILDGQRVMKDTDVTSPIVRLKIHTMTGVGSCTGTFVNPSTIITASHCVLGIPSKIEVAGFETKNYFINLNFVSLSQKAEAASEAYKNFLNNNVPFIERLKAANSEKDLSPEDAKKVQELTALAMSVDSLNEEVANNDLAVVVLNPEDAKFVNLKNYYRIPKQTAKLPSIGDYAMIVGFGTTAYDPTQIEILDRFSKSGMKNMGFVKITVAEKEKALFHVWEEGKQPVISPGDSGGPMVRCTTGSSVPKYASDCASFEIVAINQAILVKSPTEIKGKSIEVSSKVARDFFDTTIKCKRKVCAAAF